MILAYKISGFGIIPFDALQFLRMFIMSISKMLRVIVKSAYAFSSSYCCIIKTIINMETIINPELGVLEILYVYDFA
jgi:hypothetical protein